MKILRILIITVCLNVPVAYAMQETSLTRSIVVPVAKIGLATAGIFTTFDGYCMAQSGTSPIHSIPKISDNELVDRMCKAVAGIVEVGIGLTAIVIALE